MNLAIIFYIFYILFLVFLAALIIVLLTDTKIANKKKNAIFIYLIGTIIYGTLFVLTSRLEFNSYNYVYAEPVSETPISRKGSSEDDKSTPKAEDPKEQLYIDESGNGLIKGNTSKKTGEKIYHTPGSRYYNSTKIEDTERWFKTIGEAEVSGYRAPKK